MKKIVIAVASLLSLGIGVASVAAEQLTDGYYLAETQGNFEDIKVDLESSIINQGLVIDYVGYVSDMLARTSTAVEMSSPYINAVYMQFCSAKLTHFAVAENPENLAICPYVVFAYELKSSPGKISVGYRRPKGTGTASFNSAVEPIEKLLKEIVDESLE